MKVALFAFALVLFVALGAGLAQGQGKTMPSYPTGYIATYNLTETGEPSATPTVIYQDGANNRTRVDTDIGGAQNTTIEAITFTNGVNQTEYLITFTKAGPPTCVSRTLPISGGGSSTDCGAPTYQGQATVAGQSCDYWLSSCGGNSFYIEYYWNGNTPVETNFVYSMMNITMVYTSFTIETPPAKFFEIPSFCTSH